LVNFEHRLDYEPDPNPSDNTDKEATALTR
jgi:hypothetical protein